MSVQYTGTNIRSSFGTGNGSISFRLLDIQIIGNRENASGTDLEKEGFGENDEEHTYDAIVLHLNSYVQTAVVGFCELSDGSLVAYGADGRVTCWDAEAGYALLGERRLLGAACDSGERLLWCLARATSPPVAAVSKQRASPHAHSAVNYSIRSNWVGSFMFMNTSIQLRFWFEQREPSERRSEWIGRNAAGGHVKWAPAARLDARPLPRALSTGPSCARLGDRSAPAGALVRFVRCTRVARRKVVRHLSSSRLAPNSSSIIRNRGIQIH